MNTVDVLRGAKRAIQSRGWCRGHEGMDTLGKGPLCLMGAIGAAEDAGFDSMFGGIFYFVKNTSQAMGIVANLVEKAPTQVWQFNDLVADSEAEVLQVLDMAIAVAVASETNSKAKTSKMELQTA